MTLDPHLTSMTIAGDLESFPAHAELVRTMAEGGRFATLTTITACGPVEAGLPYASLVAYSVLADGSPLVCISELAEHTRNAHADPRAGVLLTGLAVDDESDPLDRPRASLVGRLRRATPTEAEVAWHLERHPRVRDYVDFPDFAWWSLRVSGARYVGGFGHMSWLTGDELASASPDPVLAHAQGAVDHMNRDHGNALLDMAKWLVGLDDATSARVHAIDRHGMTLYVERPGSGPLATARLAFPHGPLTSADQIRSAVVELAYRARSEATRQS